MTIDAPIAAQIPDLRKIWKQAFGDTDTFLDTFFSKGFSPERCRCVTLDGIPVAALYWFDFRWQHQKLAYLYAVATLPPHQGQGLCRALLEDTHRHLHTLGYAGSVLVPGDRQLFSLYEKLGYKAFCLMESLTAVPGSHPANIRSIDPATYEALCQSYLPQNSVIPTGSTLEFFGSYGQFFAGENTLFCLSREGDTVYFEEFWGNQSSIAGILAALQAEKGVLRLPGGNTPFAMYRSLTADNATPAYLGFAMK